MKHTKIIATVSDLRCETDFIKSLADAGVNVVRMNSAHLSREGMEKIVRNTRAAEPHLALMIDTKGPEIRTTINSNGSPISFATGDKVRFVGDINQSTNHDVISLNYSDIATYLQPGDRLLIDDGELEFVVDKIENQNVYATSENGGVLGSRKSVNVPGRSIPLPSVTERDAMFLKYAAEMGVDFVAHSFVRSAADVEQVKKIIADLGSEMQVISKIENQEGVDNFDEILAASYGIMVARGDLGIEVAAETIPGIQLKMINKCISAHKPVIVATQMLHTMIEHPRPTRAEVSDVANAVYQHVDATMLSGETANGKYPLEAVRTMSRIACEVEREIQGMKWVPPMLDSNIASFVARTAVVSEKAVGTTAIITDAYHGATARFISAYRGQQPVYAICYSPKVARWLALSYGVVPYMPTEACTSDDCHTRQSLQRLEKEGRLSPGQLVAYISGTSAGARTLQIAPINELTFTR